MPKQTNKEQSNPRLFAPLAVGILIGALAVGTAVLVWNHDSPSRSRSAVPTYSGSIPMTSTPLAAVPSALESAVTRVAARFACSCGTCGEKRLDVCSCETAQAERAFLQNQLRDGRTESEAADALNKKYGGLKS